MPFRFGSRDSAVAALVTVVVVGWLSVAVLAPAGTARAAAGCQATYQVNQWTGGFTATVTVTAGANPVHGWAVTWTYTAGQQVTSGWNAQVSQVGRLVTATSLSYNGELAAGGNAQFGLQGTYSGSNPTPTDLTVTGSGCAAAATPSPTGSAGASPSPSPSPATGCGTAVLCDGFENQSPGTPAGAWGVTYPNCSGAGTATVDASTAHSGGKSVRVTGAAGYCNHVFVMATQSLSTVGPIWYGRFYLRHTTALPAAHVTFVALKDANDGGNDLRMGGQNGALQWNRQSDDATLPEQSPAGIAQSVPLPTGPWLCVEFTVNGTAGTMDTWIDGSPVAGLHEDGTATHDIDAQWLARAGWHPAPADFRLGWESYGDGTDTLWFDDVALGASRIGC